MISADYLSYIGRAAMRKLAEAGAVGVVMPAPSPSHTRIEQWSTQHACAATGLDSGLMMVQYAAAALVPDSKTLAHPDQGHARICTGRPGEQL